MAETIITSSVLIIIITGLRYLLRGKISSRLQYALWVLVAIRLLLPFSLFESPVSVMHIIQDIQRDDLIITQPVNSVNTESAGLPVFDSPVIESGQEISGNLESITQTMDGKVIARFIWFVGFIFCGAFFAISNICLNQKFRKIRKRVEELHYLVPVYVAEGLPSPCLYGFIKPGIYITPESLSDEKQMRYVIAHELTHYRQKDHIWSFIRVLCLCIHWFNPLVWFAVILSRLDSELACDEGTLQKVGPENRVEYGKILIEMMGSSSRPFIIFSCTTMAGNKGEMKERIKRIAKQPKTLGITFAIVGTAVIGAVALTFGGVTSKVPIILPQSNEVTGINLEQINGGMTLSVISISQKSTVEQLLEALTHTNKTLRASVNDAPNQTDYLQIDIVGSSNRRFYLYKDGNKYYVEEPYVGIYKTNYETNLTVENMVDGKTTINVQELWDLRTPYVGDNSAVGKLLTLLPLPNGLLHDHFELHTTGNERGISWVLNGDGRTSFSTQLFETNALLLFALIDNLEDFYVTIIDSSNNNTSYQYNRSFADGLAKGDVRDYAESPRQLYELISLAESPVYSISKLENGEPVSGYTVDYNGLFEAIIMDVMVKSAAWEGVDITSLKECYVIRQTFLKTNEVHEYYAYLLEDGSAVLQYGKDGKYGRDGQYGRYGQYSYLSKELYLELVKTWSNLTRDPWQKNIYTEGVLQPDFENLVWMTIDEKKEYCAACYQNVSREQMETYLGELTKDGWKTIRDLYEDTNAGGLYEKGDHAISIQFNGEQVILYFSLK